MSPERFTQLLAKQQAELSTSQHQFEILPSSVGVAAGELLVGALLENQFDGATRLVVANTDPQDDTFAVYPASAVNLGNPSNPWGIRMSPRLGEPAVSTLAARDREALRAHTDQQGVPGVLTAPYMQHRVSSYKTASDGTTIRTVRDIDGSYLSTTFGGQPVERLELPTAS